MWNNLSATNESRNMNCPHENSTDIFVKRQVPRRSSLPLISSVAMNNLVMPSNVRPVTASLLHAMTDNHNINRGQSFPSEILVSNQEGCANSMHMRRRFSIHNDYSVTNISYNRDIDEIQPIHLKHHNSLLPTMVRRLSFNSSSFGTTKTTLNAMVTEYKAESKNGMEFQRIIATAKSNKDKGLHVPSASEERNLKVCNKDTKAKSTGSSTDNSSFDDSVDKETGNIKETFEDNCMENKWFPNTPHPSLEYPLLFFILKWLPSYFIRWIGNLYAIRWELSYPLQKRLPLSKNCLRKIGISMTWGELLVWTPLIIILLQGMLSSFVNPSVTNSGLVSRLPLAICFLTANHNSFLTLLLGIPFERALKYHKASGYCAFINGIFHTYIAFAVHTEDESADVTATELAKFSLEGQVNTSGTLLLILILSMILTALPIVRRSLFELFYYCHIAFAVAMTTCAFYHSGLFVVITVSVLWGSDLIIRKVIMVSRYPRKANIKRLTDTVIEISIQKTQNFDYNSGQYMFIAVPELSIFQWHPFSLSSSPYQPYVTFHIRKCGHWTSALHNLAGKKKEVTVWLEGPYGSLGVDLMSNRYKMAMFLSGGIGVTPMQSVCHQMLYEHDWGERDLKKVWFIWTARDPIVMENMDVVSKHSDKIVVDSIPCDNLTSIQNCGANTMASGSIIDSSIITETILTEMPTSYTPDEELERELPIDDFMEEEADENNEGQHDEQNNHLESIFNDTNIIDEENRFQNSVMMDDQSIENMTICVEDDRSNPDEVLSLDCYLTPKEMKDAKITSLPFVHQGRPDMKKIFLSMREEAIKAGERRVAVCVCAPMRLVQICKMACAKYSNRKVRFDFHSEVFD